MSEPSGSSGDDPSSPEQPFLDVPASPPARRLEQPAAAASPPRVPRRVAPLPRRRGGALALVGALVAVGVVTAVLSLSHPGHDREALRTPTGTTSGTPSPVARHLAPIGPATTRSAPSAAASTPAGLTSPVSAPTPRTSSSSAAATPAPSPSRATSTAPAPAATTQPSPKRSTPPSPRPSPTPVAVAPGTTYTASSQVTSGSWTSFSSNNGQARWTTTAPSGCPGAPRASVSWNTPLPNTTRRWRVEVYVPGRYAASTAVYSIATRAGTQTVALAQNGYGEVWVALGTFSVGTAGSVTLNNSAGQAGDCASKQTINAAQVRWIAVG